MRARRIPFRLPPVLLTLMFTIGILSPAVAQQRPLNFGAPRQIRGMQHLTQCKARVSTAVLPQKHDVRYTVEQVAVLPGYESSVLAILNSINNNGIVAGYCYNGAHPDIAGTENNDIWLATSFIGKPGKLQALPLLSGWIGTFAWGLNDKNQVFGLANKLDDEGNLIQPVALWDHGVAIELPVLPDSIYTEPRAINNCGDLVGYTVMSSGTWLPVRWHKGKIGQLPLPAGAIEGWACTINDWGEIVGTVIIPKGNGEFDWRMYAWMPWGKDPVGVDLGNYWGIAGNVLQINNYSQAVGEALTAAGELHGFLWNWGWLKDLKTLPGGTWSQLWSINNWGQSVGRGNRADGQMVVILAQDSVLTDLNGMVPVDTPLLNNPGGINDQGKIAAVSYTPDGKTLSFVLTPNYGHFN
jgi:uncharacterized membrane protein